MIPRQESPERAAAVVPAKAQLVRAGAFRRDGIALLLQRLRGASAVGGIVLARSIDTPALEQNWRYVNRHKATLRHTGRNMYLYLLHRLGHLLNLERWGMAA